MLVCLRFLLQLCPLQKRLAHMAPACVDLQAVLQALHIGI